MAGLDPVVILAWLKEQWVKMAEQLDDFICSFDPPVPEGMDPLTVLLFGWLVACCVLAVLLHIWKRSRNSKQYPTQPADSVINSNNTTVVTPGRGTANAVKKASVPNASERSALDSVDVSFISRVQSSVPFKEAVANHGRSQSPSKVVKIPSVPGAPLASGDDEESVLWVNNVINWIYGKAEVRNNISQAWLAALNRHATKLSEEAGINLHFVDIRPESERPEFSNVVVDTGPNDNMTITADALAQPRLTTRVTYEQGGETRSATYDTRVGVLQGRVNVAALTQQNMAIGKFDGWPEVQLQLSPTDDRGRSSALEEQIRQEGAREVVTGCLRGAVLDLNFARDSDFPLFQRRRAPDAARSLSQDPSDGGGGERITRRLLVKVLKAAGLGAAKGCREPFCVVEMDEPCQKFQTSTKADTDHPFWDESFVFDLSANTSELLFEVFDSQRPRETSFLGLGIVGIEELLINPSQRQIIPLLPRPYEEDPVSGSLTVEFLFVDEDGTPVEEGMLPHRITQISERRLNSGEVLQTTHTTYTRPGDVDDGNFVKSVVLKDVDSNARRNAKKSTLIIHSSKKENVDLPAVKVQRNNEGLWVEVSMKQDSLEDAACSDPGSDGPELSRSGTLPGAGEDAGRGRKRAKRRSFFGSLRKRLSSSKSRSKSTEAGADRDWEEGAARSASLDRGHYLTVPAPEGGTADLPVDTFDPLRQPSPPSLGHGRAGGPDDSSLSDMSGISNASNRTYVNDESTLVLETTENGVLKHFLVPNNLAKRGRWRRKGTKLHIYNEHVFVAKHLPGALCSVCEKSLPRWLGKQAYECRNCRVKVHKQCHVRVETVCADSTVHTMNMEYLQTLEDKRQRNMTR